MTNVDFYKKIYTTGKRTGLFKKVSDKNQNLQVADFKSVPGSIDIHLTFDSKKNHSKDKNLHITVRYRGRYSSNVIAANNFNIKNNFYKKEKEEPSFSFYLELQTQGGYRKIKLVSGTVIPKEVKVNIQGYINRVNYLIEKHIDK